ncbi:MAG: di-trans,poly-cis-decaprenylcistransferase [Peptococcaceae bacterium]|jgi:undecaprenyl diphosphate synthase|nr:di-trans,poly-cis-decaprenylcistransferase [Peptococcaceae bacterium]
MRENAESFHLAVIMDGNGRWAKGRGLPRLMGHRAGVEALKRIVEACPRQGIDYLTVYAFSTENWRRPSQEVRGLMGLLGEYIDRELERLRENGVRIRVLGDLAPLAPALAAKIRQSVAATAANRRLTLSLALNYGGRQEILRAARALAARALAGEDPAAWREDDVAAALDTAGMPDPDLLIRTGGDLRVSNFLLWQIAYTEIWTTASFWPDFSEAELGEALLSFRGRQRRFGGV